MVASELQVVKQRITRIMFEVIDISISVAAFYYLLNSPNIPRMIAIVKPTTAQMIEVIK